jgi:hypothetical protein
MASSGIIRRVALVRTDISEELRRLLVTASVVPSSLILVTLMKEALSSSAILHSRRRENLKSYTALLFYVDNVLTSQQTRPWASTA